MYEKDLDYVMPVDSDGDAPKKGEKKKLAIIIALAVVALVAAIVLGSFLIPKSLTGSWELTTNPELGDVATPDEIEERDRVYYIFEKPNRYGQGEWTVYFDGGAEIYEYKFVEKDGVKKINLGSIDLDYKIKGSKLLGNAKCTLIYPEYTDETTGETVEAAEYVLEQTRAPKYSKDSYDDFETDGKLLSEWATNERFVSYFYYNIPYTQTVSFTDDGVMTIHYESTDLALDRYMYYAYTAKDGELTFSLVTDKDTKYTVSYEFDDDGNLKFNDGTTDASLFADAFFSDVTFYTPENLPEPSQASTEELFTIEDSTTATGE